MAKKGSTIWSCKPHTLAKHQIIRRYLSAWFPIMGINNRKIVFYDGFAGPGKYEDNSPGSPVIALRTALEQQKHLKNTTVHLAFSEAHQKRFDNLKTIIDGFTKPDNFTIELINDEFANVLNETFDELDKSGKHLAPLFALIDPFGFSGVPFHLIERLLKEEKSEAIIYFARDAVNRFYNVDKVKHHMESLYGRPVEALPINRITRGEQLRQLYEDQLKKTATFVGCFTMTNAKGRPIYDLFFVSNHVRGYVKMKEAMWAVDETGGFTFSDAPNPRQQFLFPADPIEDLAKILLSNIKSGEYRDFKNLNDRVERNTIYLSKHLRGALKRLEERGQIEVEPIKINGERRQGKSFPEGVKMKFIH